MKLSDIDLNDLDTFEKGTPHDQFALLRREAPVHRHAGAPGEEDYWCITKHEDLKHISKSPQLFSSEAKSAIIRDPDPDSLPMLRLIMLNMDPPKHRQYRAIVNKAFTPRMVNGIEAAVDRMVTEIIDNVIEKGECDFVDELAAPLPMGVICEMMGVPEEDRRAIYDLGNKMIGFDDPEFSDGQPAKFGSMQGGEASAEMFMYANKLAERVRAHPADDLATALLNAEVDGEKLTEMEFNSFFLLLCVAGNETTRTVTSNGMLDLIRNPDQRQRVLDDMSLLDSAVEEILRHEPAVHSFRRTVMADTEIRGVPIPEGDKLLLWYPAVNRDEDVFDAPEKFDVARSPNDHLSFGVGEHFCLGANLARMELRKIFGGLLTRLPDIELAAEPRRLRSNFINGVKEMRVQFTPGAKSTA
jgi:cholest-4-en-3-one 26-monooxygenase